MYKLNLEKAAVLYDEIERNSLFVSGIENEADRSIMNVTFVMKEEYNRPIYGEADATEVKSLLEDGIPVAPLPFVSSRKVN